MYQLLINTKAYSQATGEEFQKLLDACKSLEKKAKANNVEIIIIPQFPDIKDSISQNITTFSQHIDNISPGSHTGFISPDNLLSIGVKGTLLNHSEHRISKDVLKDSITKAKEIGLLTCVCAQTPQEIEEIVLMEPDYIAYEPPELIGGDVSVTTKPKSITQALSFSNSTPLLVGAGVKNSDDVSKAVELGTKGVLVASGIVKADNKKQAIEELIDGFSTKDK